MTYGGARQSMAVVSAGVPLCTKSTRTWKVTREKTSYCNVSQPNPNLASLTTCRRQQRPPASHYAPTPKERSALTLLHDIYSLLRAFPGMFTCNLQEILQSPHCARATSFHNDDSMIFKLELWDLWMTCIILIRTNIRHVTECNVNLL